MADNNSEKYRKNPNNRESYSHGYDSKFIEYLKGRSITNDAGFFIPYLRSGMSLLDCGCGPDAITINLAEFLAPGQVVGIDMAANQIGISRSHASERQISNIRFEVVNVYELPFNDNSFDAAFAHTILQHMEFLNDTLPDPHINEFIGFTYTQKLTALKKSKFRSKFKLSQRDRDYITTKGLETI